jgi:hypothetical protein
VTRWIKSCQCCKPKIDSRDDPGSCQAGIARGLRRTEEFL